jgi:hypothetical protein
MTGLRKMMLDELERRNYSQNTQRLYLYAVAEFARHFRCLRDQLGLDHILNPTASAYMWKRSGFFLCMCSSADGR